jgi:hypothetical protein
MSAHTRPATLGAVLVLLAALLLGAGSAAAHPSLAPATGVSPAQVPAGTARARITGAPILGTSDQDITPAGGRPDAPSLEEPADTDARGGAWLHDPPLSPSRRLQPGPSRHL